MIQTNSGSKSSHNASRLDKVIAIRRSAMASQHSIALCASIQIHILTLTKKKVNAFWTRGGRQVSCHGFCHRWKFGLQSMFFTHISVSRPHLLTTYLQDMSYINAGHDMRVATFTGIDWCKALHLCVPIWIISRLCFFFIWRMCHMHIWSFALPHAQSHMLIDSLKLWFNNHSLTWSLTLHDNSSSMSIVLIVNASVWGTMNVNVVIFLHRR